MIRQEVVDPGVIFEGDIHCHQNNPVLPSKNDLGKMRSLDRLAKPRLSSAREKLRGGRLGRFDFAAAAEEDRDQQQNNKGA